MNADILIDVLRTQYNNILHHEVYQCFISFLIAGVIAITSIPIVIKISGLLKLKKKPDIRSSHYTETPEFGGIVIYASILIAHFLWPHTTEQPDAYLTSLSVVGLTTLFFLGLKDDILILDPNKKLLVQVLAVSTLVILGELKVDNFFGIFGIYEIPDVVSIPFTIFIFIALINAINLIDGVDGLAGGIAFIASMSFGSWFLLNNHYSMACMAFSLSGALMGFLRFNFSKTSKIFMGDTGSLIVGFLLAFFAVKFIRLNVTYRHDANAFFSAPILAVLILIVPIFDTLRVFLVRILNRKSPFDADRNHFHHILLDNGLSHPQTSMILWAVTILNVGGYLMTYKFVSNTQAFFVLVGMFIVYLIVGYVLKARANNLQERKKWNDIKPVAVTAVKNNNSWAKRFIQGL